jgi:hypothetical protein
MALDAGWTALQWPAMEHVIVADAEEDWRAAGRLVIAEGGLASADYELRCQPGGRFAELTMRITSARGQHTLVLTAAQDGSWRVNGQPRPDLAGCVDIDINCTPLTNTLPIRRLDWAPGQARDFVMAYVSIPELSVRPVRQRYTCLMPRAASAAGASADEAAADAVSAADAGGVGADGSGTRDASAVFRYETATFRADLLVDQDGLVLDYPGFWSRIRALSPAAA